MAANKCVIVLVPNGRRQTVKVTPNTTVLQILEEVCKKHGYNVDDYDIKHFKNVLDTNAILRFTNLPNNAQLEMVPCTKTRSTSNVIIGIQLETGERLMGEFTPNATLAEVVQRISPDEDLGKTILIYMHREVYGLEMLEKTTLKSLGLNSGRAILRLIHRDPQELKTQAHVAVPLAPKPISDSNAGTANTRNNNYNSNASSTFHSNEVIDPLSLLRTEKAKTMSITSSEHTNIKQEIKPEKNMREQSDFYETEEQIPSTSKVVEVNENQNLAEHFQGNDEESDIHDIQFLGDRYAIVFNQAGVQALPKDELPDNFYDVTIDDVKVLLRDAKRRREELEDAPLLTDAQRQLNQEKRTLNHLHKYRRTIIRIQFPDQFVLQGVFGPLETVQTIKDFIKNYLIDPENDFEIYTTPPKHILHPNVRLIDENLVPSAIVYYSGTSALRTEIKDKQIDPKDAGKQAIKVRMEMIRQDDEDNNVEVNAVTKTPTTDSTCGASGSSKQNQNKTPKWFRPSSK